MAASDLVKIRRVITEDGKTTNGVEELLTLGEVFGGATATATTAGAVRQAGVVAPAAVPFADLTAAANKVNEILTALKAAGVMASS